MNKSRYPVIILLLLGMMLAATPFLVRQSGELILPGTPGLSTPFELPTQATLIPNKAASATPDTATPAGATPVADPLEGCPDGPLCTHGPDPVPPGNRLSGAPPPIRTAAAAPVCYGDGQSGERYQVMYMYTPASGDRYNQYLNSFRTWTAGADNIFFDSSGGKKRLSFVTDENCQLDVIKMQVPTATAASWTPMVKALVAAGYERVDRKYLVYVDDAHGCGEGSVRTDDRPGQENYSNAGPAWSRINNVCWNPDTVAHEIVHNLGGVQDSAPNSTKNGHCTDERDVECYADGPGVVMRQVCTAAIDEHLLDCNDNDYFAANPKPGSYLANHWNTFNSPWLIDVSDVPPTATKTPPTVTATATTNTPTATKTPKPTTTPTVTKTPVAAKATIAFAKTPIVGKNVTVRLRGWSPNEVVKLTWRGETSTVSINVSASGSRNLVIKVPASIGSRTPNLEATGTQAPIQRATTAKNGR